MPPICNIAAYSFTVLEEPHQLADAVRAQAERLGLKGTCLVAHEGINLFMAASDQPIRAFIDWLQADTRFLDMPIKKSYSEAVPFKRLIVRVKPEIIRMNHPAIQPGSASGGRAPAITAATLKRWLDNGHDDNGRPVVTLDTRNAFESDVGTFSNAIDWRIDKFTEFPKALLDHRDQLAGKTVVSFCTGGIRCEKAAIFMREAGVEDVYQLDGGILKYLEVNGSQHFEGDCFVFDDRRALDPTLKPRVDVLSSGMAELAQQP